MGNGRGGARTGAGRKRKPLADKILEGNRNKEPIKKLNLPVGKLQGEDMPQAADFLRQNTKNATQNIAPKVYEETWAWLKARKCDHLIKKELVEQYALYISRWVQCEEAINTFGLLAKHPTTGMPISSPYVSMGINYLKQANGVWAQIFQVIKDNCETPIGDNPNDDIMEKILSGRF